MLGVLFAVIGTFTLVSCGSESNTTNTQNIVNNSDDIKEKTEEKQKYVIELNMDNYAKYIDVKSLPVGTGSSIYFIVYFQGSLTYAYYDNVVITSHYSKTGQEGYDTEIALSTGGYARWYSSGGNGSYEIKGINGKVIYWI